MGPNVADKLAGLFAQGAQQQETLRPMPVSSSVCHPTGAVCDTLAGMFAQAAQSAHLLTPMPLHTDRSPKADSTPMVEASAGAPKKNGAAKKGKKKAKRAKAQAALQVVEYDSTYASSDSDSSPPLKPQPSA